MDVEKFRGTIHIAVIYRAATVCYALADNGEFFRISERETERIPRKKKTSVTPINPGYDYVRIEDGQRISFESLKKTRGKNRWARSIKLIGLGKLT